MKSLSILCISCFMFLISSSLYSETITWKGGTPGDETNWTNPKNWKSNSVPTEISDVVIPNTSTFGNHYPVINSRVQPIGSLLISGGAELHVTETGLLIVDGTGVYNYGVLNLGSITINGEVFIENSALEPYLGDDDQHACYAMNKPKVCNYFQLVNIDSKKNGVYWASGRRVYGSN